MGLGTAIIVVAVLVGGGLGALVGSRLSETVQGRRHARRRDRLLVGIASFLEYGNPLVPLVSSVAGLVVGELLGIDDALRRIGDRVEKRFARGESPVRRLSSRRAYRSAWAPLP
jgi:uncharacterized protein